jgi:hypothetical protein
VAKAYRTIIKGGFQRMKKTDWQYLVDTLLFICMVGIALIGFLMGLIIPKGPQASETTKYFLGLHRHQWGNIHFYLAIAFVGLIVIHLILSWKWIKGKARQLFKRAWKTILILTAGISVVVLILFWAFYPKVPGAYEGYGVGAGRRARAEAFEGNTYPQEERIFIGEGQEYILITGQMTFLDVEKATDLSAREIVDELGLPPKVSVDETLGQLRKRYPFTMQEVRDVVSELLDKKETLAQEVIEEKESEMIDKQETDEKISGEVKENQHIQEEHREEHKQELTRGRMAEDTSGILITGQMTLYDVELRTGISARKIADRLGIPPNAPLHEHLGRLRKRYFFTLVEVRDVVASLMKKNKEEN